MSNDKLKPCEHCGGTVEGHSSHVGHWVHCECQEPVKTREEAAIQWNTRTPDTRIEDVLKRIEIKLDGVGWGMYQVLEGALIAMNHDKLHRDCDCLHHEQREQSRRATELMLNEIKSILEGTQ